MVTAKFHLEQYRIDCIVYLFSCESLTKLSIQVLNWRQRQRNIVHLVEYFYQWICVKMNKQTHTHFLSHFSLFLSLTPFFSFIGDQFPNCALATQLFSIEIHLQFHIGILFKSIQIINIPVESYYLIQ